MFFSKCNFLKQNAPNIDEELLDLKEELSKLHQLYEDNLSLINKMPESEKTPILPFLTRHKRDFFNHNPKNQETHRVKFLGNMLKNMVYYNNFEAYLDDFSSKKEKLLFSNKDPDEIRGFLQEKMQKKLALHENFLRKLLFFSRESDKDLLDLQENIAELRDLIEKMEQVTFLEKRNEDELITERHLYENFKQQMQDNFSFLSEWALKEIIEDFADYKVITLKTSIFKSVLDQLPSHLHFLIMIGGEDLLQKEKRRLFYEKSVKIPQKLDEVTKKLVNLARENGINADISVDNGAFLLFKVEEFFKQTYKDQSQSLNFLQFRYQNESSPANSPAFSLIAWENEDFPLPFSALSKENAESLYFLKRIEEFKDSLVGSWLNTLLINEENEVNMFIEKKCREYYEQHKKELYLPEIYFEFYKAFLKLSLVSSRGYLIKILSYLNYFREFEREFRLLWRFSREYADNPPDLQEKFMDFGEKVAEFDENDVLIVRKNSRKTLYDISLQDFQQEVHYIHGLTSFYISFKQPKVPLSASISLNIEAPVFDNIDRQELTDETLRLHMRFLLEKVKLLKKYKELTLSITKEKILKGFWEMSASLMASKPRFPLFNEQIMNTYAIELSSLETYHELLISLVNFHQEQQKILLDFYRDKRAKPLLLAIEGLQEEKRLLLSTNSLVKLLFELNSSLQVIRENFKEKSQVDRNIIENVFVRRALELWTQLIEEHPINEYINEYNFIDHDEILDDFGVYDNFMAFMLRGSLENKTDSPKLKRSLQASNLQSRDKLILSLNLIEFIRTRSKIRKFLYSLSVSLQTFKEQQVVFLKDPTKIENVVGISLSTSSNFLKNFISLEGLKCNMDVLLLRNWVIYLINQKKMDEPFLYLQYLFTLNSLTNVYIAINNQYLSRILKEFSPKTQELTSVNLLESSQISKKLQECSQDFFYDIFEKKKNVAFKILSFKRVSIFTLSANANANTSHSQEPKILNKNVNYNPFFSKGYKSANAQIINDFTGILNKEIHYEVMKLNTILLRDCLEDLNKKLPRKLKLFKQVPLIPPKHLHISSQNGQNLKASVFFTPASKPATNMKAIVETLNKKTSKKIEEAKEERNNQSFNESLLNIGVLPSIEDIMKYDCEDLPKETSTTAYEDASLQEKQMVSKILEARGEIKSPLINEAINTASKRRSSLLLTPVSQIHVFKKDNRKKVLKNKEFQEFNDSPVFFLMNCFFHLYNIISNEIFVRVLENCFLDVLYFESGLMDEEGFASQQCQKDSFEDLKRNVLRISHKLQNVREDIDKIDKNFTFLQEKILKTETISAINPIAKAKKLSQTILKYLRTVHKRQYSSILLSLFIEIKEKTRQNHEKNNLDGKIFRDFLCNFCFNKVPDMYRAKGNPCLFRLSQQTMKTKGLYNEKSPIMEDLEEVFLNEISKEDFSLNIFKFFRKNNKKTDFLRSFGLMNLSSEGKRRFYSNYQEINRVLFIRFLYNNQDKFELEFETQAKKALQINIKYYIFKEIAMTLQKDFEYLPFSETNCEEITKKMGFFSAMFQKEEKLRVLVDPERNSPLEISKFLLEEGFLKGKMDFLCNEIEKCLIKNCIDFYLTINQVYSLFKSNSNYKIEIVSATSFDENASKSQNNNKILRNFYNKILSKSCFIDILKVGQGIVIPVRKFKEDLDALNYSFLKYFSRIFHLFLSNTYHEKDVVFSVRKIIENRNENNVTCVKFINNNMAEIVESKIAKRSADLLFSLDHLYKSLNYMKDEEALREQEIKKITRNEFSERIVDKKNELNNINCRLKDHKKGMTLDLKKHIEEAKNEAERRMQMKNLYRPSFVSRFKQIFQSTDQNDTEEIDVNSPEHKFKYNDKAKMYRTFAVLRIFYLWRHEILKEKHRRDLEQKNQKLVSSEVLWNKIKDLEKNELKIKESLVNSEKQIAILEHQNLVLKRDVRNITLEKVQLYKSNNLQRGQILELQETFEVLRRKKFIENKDPETLVRVHTRPMSSANKLLRQQTEMFALNDSSPKVNEIRSFSAQKISKFEENSIKKTDDSGDKRENKTKKAKKFKNKQFFYTQKKKDWNFQSALFVQKKFKITNMNFGEEAMATNLNFYLKKEKL